MKDSRGVSRPESEIAAVIAVAMLTLVMSFRTMAQDPSSDIAISMTGSPSAVVPGSNVTYTIAITGPTTATGVTVTDVLPAGIIFVSAKVGSVSCPLPNEPATKGLPGATVTCSVGALTSGRATVTIVVKPPQTPGTMTNIAGVIGDQYDEKMSNNSATATTTILGALKIENDAAESFCTDSFPLTIHLVASGGAGPPYTWTAVTTPNNGVLTINGEFLSITGPGSWSVALTVKDSAGNTTTKTLSISVSKNCTAGAATFHVQPRDAGLCPGQSYQTSAYATYDDLATPTYKWETLVSGTWVAASGTVTSCTITPPLVGSCFSTTPSSSPTSYRVTVTRPGGGGATTSRVATAWVGGPIEFEGAYNSVICQGQPVNFSSLVIAYGCNLSITWQQQNPIDNSWSDVTVFPVKPTQTTKYRAILHADSPTQTLTTGAITVQVIPQPLFTQPPVSANFCSGSAVTASASTNSQGYFKWDRWNTATHVWEQVKKTTSLASSDTMGDTPLATTDYRLTFSSPICAADITTGFTLTQITAPTISNVPANLPICPPQATTYSAAVTGATSVQWQQLINGTWTNIAGATSASWTTPMLTTPGTYNYRLAATNSCGSAYANSTITVNPKPSVSITGPCSKTANETITLTASTDSASPPRFYWSPDGQTTAWIDVSPTVATTYTCYVTAPNGCSGSATYTVAVGSHIDPPNITAQPQNVLVCSGMTGTLSVGATGTNLAYQWQVQSGSNWSNVTGATAVSYTAPSANATYRVVISNTCGSVTSSPAMVTVDSSQVPPTITVQPRDAYYCPGGPGATLSVGATGTSLSYSWEYSPDNVWWGPAGSGATVTVSPSTVTRYRARVWNNCRTVYSNVVIASPTTPPSISSQPQNSCVGGQMSVAAWQGGNVFQWQIWNGSAWANVAGVDQSSFTPAVAGTYHVVITNACGTVTSANATAYTTPSTPVIVVNGPTTINQGDPATLFVDWASCDSCTQFQWLPSYYISPYRGVTFYPDQTTTYSVIGYNAGGCRSQSAPATITVSLAPNPSFENGGPTWFDRWGLAVYSGAASAAVSTAPVASGTRAARVTVTSPGDVELVTTPEPSAIPVEPGKTYTLSAKLLSSGGAQAGLRIIEWNASGGFIADRFLTNGGGSGAWTTLTNTFTVSANTYYISIRLMHHISTGTFTWDDVMLTKVGP